MTGQQGQPQDQPKARSAGWKHFLITVMGASTAGRGYAGFEIFICRGVFTLDRPWGDPIGTAAARRYGCPDAT
jgi:hypothetical protein